MTRSDEQSGRLSGREIYDATISGAQDRPFIPRLRSDQSPSYHPLPKSLVEFREGEGREERKRRLRALWQQLPRPERHVPNTGKAISATDRASLTPEKAEALKLVYENELLRTCGGYASGNATSPVDWKEFRNYAEAKEVGTCTQFCCSVLFG